MNSIEVALGTVVILLALESSLGAKATQSSLQNVAEIEGITYYAEINRNMSWEAGFTFCRANNMKLAEITTHEHSVLLSAHLVAKYGIKYFWTSAREARTHSALVWNQSGQPVGPGVTFYTRIQEGYFYCGAVTGQKENPILMSMTFCLDSHPVLCMVDKS